MLDVQFGQASDRGTVCTDNHGSMGAFIPSSHHQARTHGYLFVVSDGLEAPAHGEDTASTAVRVLTREFVQAPSDSMLISLLPLLIATTQAAAYDHADPLPDGERSTTALVACALRHDQAVVSHIGDSRCYLVRDGRARQITQDGVSATPQHPPGPFSHEPTCRGNCVSPYTTALTLLPGDVLVLCSNSVHHQLGSSAITRIALQPRSAAETARELVASAIQTGGGCNATAQVIRIRSVEPAGMYRDRADRTYR